MSDVPQGSGAPPRHGLGLGLLITLAALAAFGPLSLDVYLPSLPRIADQFGASDGATALSVSGCMVGLAVGQLVAGPLSDRFGRRRPLLIGLIAFMVASVLCAVAPSLWFLIVVRVAQGLAGATGLVIGRAVVRDLAPAGQLAYIFSILALVGGIAPVVAPLLGAALLRVMPWRGVFGVLAAIAAAITALVLVFLRESLPPERRHAGGLRAVRASLSTLARDRAFVGAMFVVGFGSAAMFTYISLSSFVLQDHYGLSATGFSAVFAGNGIALAMAGWVNAVAVRRMGVAPRTMIGVAVAIMLVADAALITAAVGGLALWLLLAALFVAIGVTGLIFPNGSAIGLAGHGSHAGTASALLGALQFVFGATAGPVASSFGVSATSMAVAMTAWACLAGAIWLPLLRRQPR
ncbi:MAG: multidrug effflux MFS transporter [Actinomycetia bacterium]|nr:multidrug effflux MFS transporter [Actinomycetes bacterium]